MLCCQEQHNSKCYKRRYIFTLENIFAESVNFKLGSVTCMREPFSYFLIFILRKVLLIQTSRVFSDMSSVLGPVTTYVYMTCPKQSIFPRARLFDLRMSTQLECSDPSLCIQVQVFMKNFQHLSNHVQDFVRVKHTHTTHLSLLIKELKPTL